MSRTSVLVTDLAARQHGLIARSQALAAGLTPGEVARCVTGGRWIRLVPGVYRVRGAPVTWHMKLLAACLSTGGVASHRSSAVLHEVAGFQPGSPEITVDRVSPSRRVDARVHRSTDLRLTSPVVIHGIPTTRPSRLAVDLGAVVPFERYEAAMHDLIARKKLSWDDAMQALFAHSRQGRNGCGPLRALLDAQYGTSIAESVLERTFIGHFDHLTIPRPIAQHEIFDEQGFVARVDYAFPEKKIAIELDGRRYHLNAHAFEEDKRKRNRLKLAGWVVYEITWRMLIDRPHVVFGELDRLYHSR